MERMPYMSDPTIIPRVQKYLESNMDKTYVDINVMADDLQQKYKEYAKRKRSAFRASVNKAYSIVLRSYGLDDPGSSEEETEFINENDTLKDTLNNKTILHEKGILIRNRRGVTLGRKTTTQEIMLRVNMSLTLQAYIRADGDHFEQNSL